DLGQGPDSPRQAAPGCRRPWRETLASRDKPWVDYHYQSRRSSNPHRGVGPRFSSTGFYPECFAPQVPVPTSPPRSRSPPDRIFNVRLIPREGCLMAREKFTFFWQGPFSQWHPSPFSVSGRRFSHAEQFMMYCKAILFHDSESAEKILQPPTPQQQ